FVPFLGNDQSGHSLDGTTSDPSLSCVDVLDIPTGGTTTNVPENVSATNTGTFADNDEPVTITASRGSINQNGSQSGTWNWSGTGDESSPYTVTITATNADGSTASTAFAVSFTDVAPTVSAEQAAVSAAENQSATNTGTFGDYDNAVILSASSGTVTQSGGHSGTLSRAGSGDEGGPRRRAWRAALPAGTSPPPTPTARRLRRRSPLPSPTWRPP